MSAIISQHGAITVLRPAGPLRHDVVDSLQQQLEPMLRGGIPCVVLDMAETPLIDGAGLEWVLGLDESCCRRGGCVRLCNVGELCQDIFRVTCVGSTVQRYDDLTAALGSFA